MVVLPGLEWNLATWPASGSICVQVPPLGRVETGTFVCRESKGEN